MVDLYCMNLAKLKLHFPEFLSIHNFKLALAWGHILLKIWKVQVKLPPYCFYTWEVDVGSWCCYSAHTLLLICWLTLLALHSSWSFSCITPTGSPPSAFLKPVPECTAPEAAAELALLQLPPDLFLQVLWIIGQHVQLLGQSPSPQLFQLLKESIPPGSLTLGPVPAPKIEVIVVHKMFC